MRADNGPISKPRVRVTAKPAVLPGLNLNTSTVKKSVPKVKPRAKPVSGVASASVGASSGGKATVIKPRLHVVVSGGMPSLAYDTKKPGVQKGPGGAVVRGGPSPLIAGSGLVKVGQLTAQTVASDPLHQGPKLITDEAKGIVSIPAGLAMLAVHPAKTAKLIGKDYSRRYGPIASGDYKAFLARQKKEGVAAEVNDLAGALSVGGATVGRAAQAAAKAGALGRTLEDVATTARRTVRISGGVTHTPELSKNLGKNVVGRVVDKSRAAKTAKRAAKNVAPLEVRQAVKQGEVTYRSMRKTHKAQRVAVAKGKGVAVAQMKGKLHAEYQPSLKNTASLKGLEAPALKYVQQLGLPGSKDVAGSARELKAHLDRIAFERLHNPEMRLAGTDEMPVIQKILANPHKAFTARVDAVRAAEKARNERVVKLDPGVKTDVQAELRAHAPLAEHVGVQRAGIPIDQALTAARREVKSAKRVVKATTKRYARAERTAGVSQGRAEILVKRSVDETGTTPKPTLRKLERHQGKSLHAERAVTRAEQRVLAAEKQLVRVRVAKNAGERLVNPESDTSFLARIRAAAKTRGLVEPGYFKSEEAPRGVFSNLAVGGSKATAGPKHYTGALFRTGRESTDPTTMARSTAQSIKRHYNWNLVKDQLQKHSFDWSRGMTPHEIERELRRRGIDPNSVALWNHGMFEKAHSDARAAGTAAEDIAATPGDKSVADALSASTLTDLGKVPDHLKGSRGFSVIPRAAYDEIHATTSPGAFVRAGRGYDILKGKSSRILLANPAWLQAQIGSNALLTGIAGTGPLDLAKAQLWWKRLTPAEKDAVSPIVHITPWHDDQTHLGAAANGRLVNAYRALKQTSLYQAGHKANPLDAIFRTDNAQNNLFRKGVLYTQVKRDAYRRMGANAGAMQKLQGRLVNMLTVGPKEQLAAVLKDAPAIEKHAQHTLDFLGDYSTYTARERRILGRSVMFYGFLRYSLKFTLQTMPTKHPIVSAILAQLGRLQKDELEKIFGGAVPPWLYGTYVSPDGKVSAPLARLNPFLNAVQYLNLDANLKVKPETIVAVLPPFVQEAINQVAGKNVAFDTLYKTGGNPGNVEKAANLSLGARLKIATADMLNLWPVYRIATKTGVPGVATPLRGKQGSDSSLIFPEPTKYKSAAKIAANDAATAAQKRPPLKILREQILPFFGQDNTETLRKSDLYKAGTAKAKKPSASSGDWGAAPASSGGDWGGSTTTSSEGWG